MAHNRTQRLVVRSIGVLVGEGITYVLEISVLQSA